MKQTDIGDTIFALSTPVGGAIAVLRASGKDCLPVLSMIFDGRIEPRTLNHGHIHDAGKAIDDVMAVYFEGPCSYTGEDMFELHLHGSYAVCTAVSRMLAAKGLRNAGPGEFTRRAFLNGKMDLVQADAVMDLILTETERGANAALEQLEGGLSRRISEIEQGLIELASELCAAMDYPEEMEDETLSSVPDVIDGAVSALKSLIEEGSHGRILREGAKVVILGRPNVGKSSLLNALAKRERAIVTSIAGTTRDILEEHIEINGIPLRIVDTAGIHGSDDVVESIGMERALAEAKTAELVLLIFDGSESLDEWDLRLLELIHGMQTLYVINKSDVYEDNCEFIKRELLKKCELACGNASTKDKQIFDAGTQSDAVTVISCVNGNGFDLLKTRIAERLGISEVGRAIVTNERHIECMRRAVTELETAKEMKTVDMTALALENALSELGCITGRTVSEEILNKIFERFCVGK